MICKTGNDTVLKGPKVKMEKFETRALLE